MALAVPLIGYSILAACRGRNKTSEVQFKAVSDSESWYSQPVEAPRPEPTQYVVPAQSHYDQDDHFDEKRSLTPRPLSTVGSMAHWSDTAETVTLAHASIRSTDTKRPPSYASPAPSRAATNIHRKPLN